MMPLALAKPGETFTIGKITGKDQIRQHLAELGFVVMVRSLWSARWAAA